MELIYLAEVVPRAINYASDIGLVAVVAYVIALIPIVFESRT